MRAFRYFLCVPALMNINVRNKRCRKVVPFHKSPTLRQTNSCIIPPPVAVAVAATGASVAVKTSSSKRLVGVGADFCARARDPNTRRSNLCSRALRMLFSRVCEWGAWKFVQITRNSLVLCNTTLPSEQPSSRPPSFFFSSSSLHSTRLRACDVCRFQVCRIRIKTNGKSRPGGSNEIICIRMRNGNKCCGSHSSNRRCANANANLFFRGFRFFPGPTSNSLSCALLLGRSFEHCPCGTVTESET